MSELTPYINLYVRGKSKLFPLIEKHSGTSPKKMKHGEAVALYVDLLSNDQEFSEEVETIIQSDNKYHNSIGTWFTGLFNKSDGSQGTKTMAGVTDSQGNFLSDAAASSSSSGFSGILGAIGNVFSSIKDKQTAQINQDTVLYQGILQAQGGSDITKILIVSGVSLLFVGAGIFLVIKMKK